MRTIPLFPFVCCFLGETVALNVSGFFLQYRHSEYLKRHSFGECDGSPHLKHAWPCALYGGSGSDLRAACPCGIILFTSAPSCERSCPVEHIYAALAVADSIARAIWKALAKSRSVSDNRRR